MFPIISLYVLPHCYSRPKALLKGMLGAADPPSTAGALLRQTSVGLGLTDLMGFLVMDSDKRLVSHSSVAGIAHFVCKTETALEESARWPSHVGPGRGSGRDRQ